MGSEPIGQMRTHVRLPLVALTVAGQAKVRAALKNRTNLIRNKAV